MRPNLAAWREKSFGPWARRIAPAATGFETTRPAAPGRYSPISLRMSTDRIRADDYSGAFHSLVHEITHATSSTRDILYSDQPGFNRLSPDEHVANADSYAVILQKMRKFYMAQLVQKGGSVPFLGHPGMPLNNAPYEQG